MKNGFLNLSLKQKEREKAWNNTQAENEKPILSRGTGVLIQNKIQTVLRKI